jgi:hypothetical protein
MNNIWFDESCAVDPLPGIPESHTIELDTEHPFAR